MATLVAETPLTDKAEKARVEKHLTKVVRWAVVFFFLWFVILASMDIPGLPENFKKIAGWIGVVNLGLAIVLSLYSGIRWWWLWQFGVSANRHQPESRALPPKTQTTELRQKDMPEEFLAAAHLESVPSVTEGTTELLMAGRRDKDQED